MQLFKRVLLSLFPDDIVAQTINPASMFISFISTKEFFSVINRKIVENYKLNLFDVTRDPFEFKIGFGDNFAIKPKDIDTYYSYNSTANLNGYRFFSPANIANNLALVVALYVKDIFRAYPPEYYLNFLYSIFLLTFVFLARIKVFPYTDREQNYNWFIEVLFNFYGFVFQQTGKKADPAIIKKLKSDLLGQIALFFLLFEVYHHFSTLFVYPESRDTDVYTRLFHEELQGNEKAIYQDFIAHAHDYTHQKTFSSVETKIMQSILPADILLRYLFLDFDMFLITDTIIAKIFDTKILDTFIQSFLDNDAQLENFLLYITDYRNFKKSFFSGVQKYMITTFKDLNPDSPTKDDLDDLMSSIGENIENPESFKIPERIKKESKMMEKILNFYITLIGGSRVSRGDSFFCRLFRAPLISTLLNHPTNFVEKNHTLIYYSDTLRQYRRNAFFYKHTSENVRAGKQKFVLPSSPTIKHIISNPSLIKAFDVSSIATILQDSNPKDIRLYIKNKKIIELFKGLLGTQVSTIVHTTGKAFIATVYQSIADHLDNKDFISSLQKSFTSDDVYHIKENIYNLDFWVSQRLFVAIKEANIALNKDYTDLNILQIFALIRDTFFGFLIYLTYVRASLPATSSKSHIDLLINCYLQDIIHIDPYYHTKFSRIITHLQADFNEILMHWIAIDDNKDYLQIGYDNRMQFAKNKTPGDIKKKITEEDTLWFSGFLKNITYYNKRFLMPQ